MRTTRKSGRPQPVYTCAITLRVTPEQNAFLKSGDQPHAEIMRALIDAAILQKQEGKA